jgi:hypothetical protein
MMNKTFLIGIRKRERDIEKEREREGKDKKFIETLKIMIGEKIHLIVFGFFAGGKYR